MSLSQDERLIRLEASFIKDDVFAVDFSGSEACSTPYEFAVSFLSENHKLTSADVIGQTLSVAVYQRGDDNPRYFHGRINRLLLGDIEGELRSYRCTFVPGFWFLSQASHQRIFEGKTGLDIVQEIIKGYGDFCSFSNKTKSTFLKREYTVQFGESDFDFVQRLLAEDGISYYFEFSQKDHKLILMDDPSAYLDCDEKEVRYSAGGTDASTDARVTTWQRELQYHSFDTQLIDYNHDTPKNFYKQTLATKNKFAQKPKEKTKHDAYCFNYETKSEGVHDLNVSYNKLIAKSRLEALEASHDIANGASDAVSFQAGGRFTLNHYLDSEKQNYVITSINHRADNGDGIYDNQFQCIPAAVPYRPPNDLSKSQMRGPLTAKVVALKATEAKADVDPHRLIRVEFPWAADQKSCWLRVVQAYAGAGWGGSFVPRLNQEVLVEFVNGDPDRPVCVGALYNKDNQGPDYTSTQSGFKTASDKFNEFRFDDKKGEEEIYVEAGKDYNFMIHNDEKGEIENDQELTVKQNRTLTISEGNETKKLGKGNQSLEVAGNQETKVKGDQDEKVDGDQTVKVKGDHKITVTGGSKTDSKKSVEVKAAQSIKMQANTSIELKVGGNSIKIDASGIAITGTMVKINGSAMTEVKAGGMLTVKGATVMIN